MRRIIAVVALLFLSAPCRATDAAEFEAQAREASGALERVLPACAEQMNAGDVDGANEKLLAIFPAATRTAAQSFVLGNILFDVDRKSSYALHRAAALSEPQNPEVVWEWALEQHRAREYAGALAGYQMFSQSRPQSAAPYALQADCLLRLGRIGEAVDAWEKSERAPVGTLETMESLVCAVHIDPPPHQRRAELLKKATVEHDASAACDLIALDCDFPRDWWNGAPIDAYLTHDLAAVRAALKLAPEDPVARAIECAAACAPAARDNPATVKDILSERKILIDADHTIPAHGGLLSVILLAAVQSKAIDDATLHQLVAPKLLELAKKGRDVRTWNVAGYFALPATPEEQLDFEREGWKATGDARFAAGVLFVKARQRNLSGDDADLADALKQFPENGPILRAAFETATHENKLTRELLATAAKAEFTHFSSFVAPATVVNRPRSDYLRQYFAELRLLTPAPKPEGAKP